MAMDGMRHQAAASKQEAGRADVRLCGLALIDCD